jgi:hypothetical protein
MENNQESKLTRKFKLFVQAVTDAIQASKPAADGSKVCTIKFGRKTITFDYGNAILDRVKTADSPFEHMLEIMIGDEIYSIVPSLEAKARLAKDGWLGDDLVNTGLRKMVLVEQEERKARGKQKHSEFCKLWPREHADKVWDMHIKEAHHASVAKTTLALLSKVTAMGCVPKSIEEARRLGIQFPRLSRAEWRAVEKIAPVLAGLTEQSQDKQPQEKQQ